jgi:hypothetical protein
MSSSHPVCRLEPTSEQVRSHRRALARGNGIIKSIGQVANWWNDWDYQESFKINVGQFISPTQSEGDIRLVIHSYIVMVWIWNVLLKWFLYWWVGSQLVALFGEVLETLLRGGGKISRNRSLCIVDHILSWPIFIFLLLVCHEVSSKIILPFKLLSQVFGHSYGKLSNTYTNLEILGQFSKLGLFCRKIVSWWFW